MEMTTADIYSSLTIWALYVSQSLQQPNEVVKDY